jgi:DNA-binding NarL/FixJ family response regulator
LNQHGILCRIRAAPRPVVWYVQLDAIRRSSRYTLLTPRDREVIALVVSGLLNKQVGGELGISEITVKAFAFFHVIVGH